MHCLKCFNNHAKIHDDMPLNMEFKARVADLDGARNWLISRRARFIGIDKQRDVYFRVPEGRLKLRMGNIERALIYYRRAEENDIKRSDVWLYPVQDGDALKQLLALSLGILADVSKRREIYFIGPAKFHLDHVMGWAILWKWKSLIKPLLLMYRSWKSWQLIISRSFILPESNLFGLLISIYYWPLMIDDGAGGICKLFFKRFQLLMQLNATQ
jgi:hypothetical protein